MIIETLLAAALMCPPTVQENTTNEPWNEHDAKTLAHVIKRCPQIHPDAPCVKLFRKFDSQSYSVLCGYKREIDIERNLL